MKAKLIKVDTGWILMVDNKIYASHNDILSIKNCQAVERGYDLDELAEQEFPYDFDCPLFETLGITEKSHKSILIGMLQGTLQKGFQKALEILCDKKFSEEDLEKSIIWAHDKSTEGIYLSRLPITDFIQSLQQTEWEVEIVMKNVIDETKIVGAIKGVKGSGNKITTYKQIPKLDADRCLILKGT